MYIVVAEMIMQRIPRDIGGCGLLTRWTMSKVKLPGGILPGGDMFLGGYWPMGISPRVILTGGYWPSGFRLDTVNSSSSCIEPCHIGSAQ